ncbi:MAG: hypothetical protein WCJ35_00040 [Planctomycetota bacterium]
MQKTESDFTAKGLLGMVIRACDKESVSLNREQYTGRATAPTIMGMPFTNRPDL